MRDAGSVGGDGRVDRKTGADIKRLHTFHHICSSGVGWFARVLETICDDCNGCVVEGEEPGQEDASGRRRV